MNNLVTFLCAFGGAFSGYVVASLVTGAIHSRRIRKSFQNALDKLEK
jgi:hypothetical protein